MTVETHWSDIRLRADDWAEAFEAAEPGTPHNEARDQIWGELLTILMDKHDGDASADLLRKSLLQNRALLTTFNRAWPLLDAADLVGRCSTRLTSSETCGRYPPTCASALRGCGPMRFRSCSAVTPGPGRCLTCRSWMQRGSGSATRRRHDASVGRRPLSPPSAST